jgi:DNA-binding IclR family transcriptional regulator
MASKEGIAAESAERSGGIQVISRAGQILRTLTDARRGLSLAEIAQVVDLPRSTVHRIVSALEAEGLVAMAGPTGGYRLGPEFLRMANTQRGELRTEVRPWLESLSAEVNETVDLSVLIADQVSFIDQVASWHLLRAESAVGATWPAYCSANGKAMLAQLDDADLRKLLPPRLRAFTPHTVTRRSALLEELADVRLRGYALAREEHTIGISAIGAPIGRGVGVVAALSIPVPTQRFVGREQELAAALLDTCAAIDRHLSGLV